MFRIGIILTFVIWKSVCVQAQFIELDPGAFVQLYMLSSKIDQGAQIHLGNLNNEHFIHLSSYNANDEVKDPAILRSPEDPIIFGTLDGIGKEQMRLRTDGHVQIEALKGNQTQNIVVDNEGVLKTQKSITGYGGVARRDYTDFFSSQSPEHHNYKQSGTYHENQFGAPVGYGTETLITAVHLPHSSVVKKIDLHFYDNNSDSNGNVMFRWMKKYNNGALVGSIIDLGQTTGDCNCIRDMSFTPTGQDEFAIDNILYSYEITVLPTDFGSWPGEDQIRVKSVVIYYD